MNLNAPPYYHIAAHRIMFLFVFFDLPTERAEDRKAYALFRKRLQYSGFRMLQYSVYIRDCATNESAEKHTARIKKIAPPIGHISILRVTHRQMVKMITITKVKKPTPILTVRQLSLF